MINLNLAPDAVLTLTQGDAVSVDGLEMVFEIAADLTQVFITTANHMIDEYYDLQKMVIGDELVPPDPKSVPEDELKERQNYIRHVRNTATWYAQMSRAELHQCLTSGTYTIS